MATPEKRIWTTDDAAAYLGRTPAAVRNLVLRRLIPYRKVGGRLAFIPEEIEKWVRSAPGVTLENLEQEFD